MVTKTLLRSLAENGWPVLVHPPYDLCWLDCNRRGWLKTSDDGERVICLCPQHALVLEAGAYHGDYTGAPLPPESVAGQWPWRSCLEEAAAR